MLLFSPLISFATPCQFFSLGPLRRIAWVPGTVGRSRKRLPSSPPDRCDALANLDIFFPNPKLPIFAFHPFPFPRLCAPPTSLRMKAGVLVSAHVWGCRRGASNPVIPSPPILNHPDRGFLTTVQYSTVYTATLLSRPLSHLPTPQTPPTFHRRSVVFSSTHLTSGPKPTVSSSSLIFPPRKHLDTPHHT